MNDRIVIEIVLRPDGQKGYLCSQYGIFCRHHDLHVQIDPRIKVATSFSRTEAAAALVVLLNNPNVLHVTAKVLV